MNASAPVSERYRKPLLEAAILQVLVVILAGMILDGGKCLYVALLSVMAHWAVSVIILVRRPYSPTKGDLVIVGRVFLLMLLVIYLLGTLVMEVRGIDS